MLRLQVQSPVRVGVGAHAGSSGWMFLSHIDVSFSLSLLKGEKSMHISSGEALKKRIEAGSFTIHSVSQLRNQGGSPGWCGSVDLEPACWFDPQSGHTPRLQARSPVGCVGEATR